MPACCSPSGMPGGSGRKVIAAQDGGAFPGAFVAAVAVMATKTIVIPIATETMPRMVLSSPCQQCSAYTPTVRPQVELTVISRSVCDGRRPPIPVLVRRASFWFAALISVLLKAAPAEGAGLALVLAV